MEFYNSTTDQFYPDFDEFDDDGFADPDRSLLLD